jgi:hypothetical protein
MSERPFDFSEQAPRVLMFVLIGLFVLASLYTLYFARAVLIPVVVAVIPSWILSPAGTLIAVPLLVSFRIFCASVPALHPLCNLIGNGTGRKETG